MNPLSGRSVAVHASFTVDLNKNSRFIRKTFGFLAARMMTAIVLLFIPTMILAQGTIAFSSSSLDFGPVMVGSSRKLNVALKNIGTAPITFSSYAVQSYAADFHISGLSVPQSLSVGQSLVIAVLFSPVSAGGVTTALHFASNATNPSAQITLSGIGVPSTALYAIPAEASFGDVPLGTTNSQGIWLKNSTIIPITFVSYSTSGAAFTFPNMRVPYTLAAGQGATLMSGFSPQLLGPAAGSIRIMTNVTGLVLTIPTSGSGIAATRYLKVSSTSLNFGKVAVGSAEALELIVTNIGNSNVTISSVATNAADVRLSGLSSAMTIAPEQSASLDVEFFPKYVGTVSGQISIMSNASNAVATVAVTGQGALPSAHSVELSWHPSTSSGLAGYYVYRSTGGPYMKIVTLPLSGTQYVDHEVESGVTYEYAVTAVSVNGTESGGSNQVSVAVP